ITFAPAFTAISALPSVEPSSTTMISTSDKPKARTLPSSPGRFSASLKTGITIERSQALAIDLDNRVAVTAKQALKMAGCETVPDRKLCRRQIIAQESYQQLLSDQEMSQA